MHTVLCLKYIPKSSSFLCSLLLKGLFLLMLSFRAWILNLPLVCLKCLRRKCTALEHFPVPTERSGTVLTIMGTPLEPLAISSQAIYSFPVPLRFVRQWLVQHLKIYSCPDPTERSRTVMSMFWGVIHHCTTERNGAGRNVQGTLDKEIAIILFHRCQSVIRSVCAYISLYLWRPITISNWWQTNHKVVQQQNPNSHWKWNHKHPNSIHQTEVTEVVLNNCLWSLDCWNFIAVVEPRNSLPRPHIEC